MVKKKIRISYDDWKAKLDIFEYRWNNATNDYYLFNPWTGETILTSIQNLSILDRSKSMWAKPEKFPSVNAKTTQLYPEYYASRRWGRRKFEWNLNYDAAAIHIVAVMRGYMTRLAIRRYYRERYHLQVCKFSGYYYYVDKYFPDKETSWYKPLLAFPGDILPAKAVDYDPEDYMMGEKYSRRSFTAGPFLKISGLSKNNTVRSHQPAFHIENPWRDQAISSYEEIDFENASIGTIIAWMDGSKASQLCIDEYHLIRTAICHNNWTRVIACMREHADNNMIQLYGLLSFSKTEVPRDHSGVLSFAASDAMDIIINTISDVHEEISVLVKVFALNAFHNILSVRAGRLDFLDTKSIREAGDERQKAIERYLHNRLSIFTRFFTKIQTETVMVYKKGQKDAIPEERPLQRSIDAIEATLKCLCAISQENEIKEQLATLVTRLVVRALEICEEESYVTALSLQLFYNLCYRCEGGQEVVLACCDRDFFATIHFYHSADVDVMRQCRKLELALQPNGWRGNVEEEITKEFYVTAQNILFLDDLPPDMLSSLARGFLGDNSDKSFVKIDPVWGFAEFPPPGDTKKHTLPIFIDPEAPTITPEDVSDKVNDNKKTTSSHSKREQYWMPDRYCKACYGCEEAFTMYRRRHHCRMCGQVFCNTCSNFYIDGIRFNTQSAVRYCKLCHNQLSKQTEKDIKIGAKKVSDPTETNKSPALLSSHTEVTNGKMPQNNEPSSLGAGPVARQESSSNKNIQNRALMHMTAIVDRLVTTSSILSEAEGSLTAWKETIVSLVREVVSSVDPDVRGGDSLDIRPYVKIKIIPGGNRSDTIYIDGVLFRKNVSHKKMFGEGSRNRPRILLLSGGIEFQRTDTKLSSMDTLIEQEDKYMEILVQKIMSLRPEIILVGKAVARKAQELLCVHQIVVMQNVKPQLLERLSRMTGAMLLPSTDHMIQQFGEECLGTCQTFWLQVVQDDPERLAAEHPSRILKTRILRGSTYAYFQGCPAERGCSIRLRGENRTVLREIKRIIKFSIVVAYHLRLEVSYYCDRQAELPITADNEDYDDCSDSDDGIYDVYDRERAPVDSSSDEDSDDNDEDDDYGDAMLSDGEKSDVVTLRKTRSADAPAIPSIILKRGERQLLSTSLDIDFKLPSSKELRGIYQSQKKIVARKLSVEDHQTLLITTVIMNDCGGTIPVQKSAAEVSQSKYYTKQDIALGQFIVEKCLRLNQIPRDPRILEQTLSFIHRSGRIDITVQKIANDSQAANSNESQSAESPRSLPILISSFCKDCKRVVIPSTPISEETWKISFGKFLEMSFYNRSARCKAGGCHHSLRDSHKLSFYCDGYKANFEFFPQHSFALHIRNGMKFPADFHVEHTTMLMKNLPIKHSILLDEFRMTLVALEKKIREVLMTRPEELTLAMSDIRIIENELHSNAISFLEDLLRVYNYLPAAVRDIEYESKLESQLREKRLWSSSVFSSSFSDSYDSNMIAKKEEFSHPHRDSSNSVDMRNNNKPASQSGDSDGEGDANPHFEDIYNRPSTFFAMDFIKSSIPFSTGDNNEDVVFRKSADVDYSSALAYRDSFYAGTDFAKVAVRFPMYLLCETYIRASKWNNTIDSIDKYLESVILHQQQQQLQQQQMSVATATLIPVGEESIVPTANAAVYNESDVYTVVKEPENVSDKGNNASGIEHTESVELKLSSSLDRAVTVVPNMAHPAASSDIKINTELDLAEGAERTVGEPPSTGKAKNDHVSLAIAVASAGSPSRPSPATSNNGPIAVNHGMTISGADEADSINAAGPSHGVAAVPEPLFLPNIIGMITGENNSTNPPVPPIQYHSLSQALEYYRRTATEKPVDKMSRITKALKGFLGGLQKDAEEQSRFFVHLGDFGEGHLGLRPGRHGEIIQVHEDEYATIIAYTLASQEYYDALQIHIREENDNRGYSMDPVDIGDDQSVHRPSRSIEDTLVIFGDVATVERDDFIERFRKSSFTRGGKEADHSSSLDLPLNADTARLSPVPETKHEDDNDDDMEDNEIERDSISDAVKMTDKKPTDISELERAFAASGLNNPGMDAKEGNFSVFSGGNTNFSVFGGDFTDEADSREGQSNQDITGSRTNRQKSVDGHTGGSSILNHNGIKLNISSSISKVMPSLSAISGRSNAQPQISTQLPSVPEYSNAPGNRSSTRNIPKVDPTNASREKSPIEKQMVSQNKRIIRHKFEDRDEKGNVACKFQCYVYFAKQFEALRQCYFNEKDNENFIRSLSMSRRWTAQGGKSGASFSKTLDDRIVLKVVSQIELRMFNDFAPAYFEYMSKAYFNGLPTVLCKILGVYTVRYHNKESGKRVAENVLVMENIFYKRNITRTFDLKGSSRNRYIGVGPEQKLDTFDEALQKRRRERRRFLSSMEPSRREACFKVHKWQRKKKDNARHRLEATRRNEILQNLRTALTEICEKGEAVRNTGTVLGPEDVEEFLNYESFFEPHQQLKINQVLLDDNLIELTKGKPFPLKHKAKTFFHKAVLNDTLFLSFINVVDYSILVGFDENSHEIVVGMIDYLRQYDLVKKGERIVKSVGMFAGQAEPTIIQPLQYRKRFTSAMERYFMSVPDKWI